MKFRYLGTGAAEGIPAMFCHCPLCEKARALGGKNIRSRAQALVNDDLLLDLGPDTYWHVCRFGVDLAKIRTLLITHAHEDHYTPSELAYRRRPFAYLSGDKAPGADDGFPRLDVYISRGSYDYRCVLPLEQQEFGSGAAPLDFHVAEAFRPFAAGRYTVTPLTANHAPGFEALNYIVSDGERSVFYAHDTGLLPEETYAYLAQAKPHLDLISFDCTGMAAGHDTGGGYHMNLARNLVTRERLCALGLADENTVWCVNHFSHNGKSTHEELCEIMAKEGFLVSYDGMTLEM